MPAIIDLKTKEGIIAEYAISNSVNGVAKKYGISWATAKKIINEAETEIDKIRDEKRIKYVSDAWEVVYAYTNKLLDPKTIKEAKARDCISVVSGLIERIQKQQELNQQFDFMYEKIQNEMMSQFFQEASRDDVLYKEMIRFVDGLYSEGKDERKEMLRQKIKEKNIRLYDYQSNDDKKNDIEKLLDEAKKELLDEFFNEEAVE